MPTSPSAQFISAVPHPKSRRRRPLFVGGAVAVLAVGGFAVVTLFGGATETTTRTHTGVESIVVHIGAGNVTLTGTNGTDVAVRTTTHSSITSTPVTSQNLSAGVLTISASCPPPNMNCGVDEELTVPSGVPVDIQLSAGEINAADLDVSRFQAAMGSGRVDAAFVSPPDLVDIETRTGEVVATLPDVGYRIDAETSTGTVDIDLRQDPDASRSLRVHTGTGTVTVGRN